MVDSSRQRKYHTHGCRKMTQGSRACAGDIESRRWAPGSKMVLYREASICFDEVEAVNLVVELTLPSKQL